MANNHLDDRCVVVIGGTSGIGFAVAQRALAEGARVVIGSSHRENVESALKRLGPGATGAAVDVREDASVASFFEQVGSLDHLVFTAGDWAPLRTSAVSTPLDAGHADAVFAVRFRGALAAVKHAHERMAVDGSIALTDGLIAHRPRKGAALSSAMAGAIEHLTRALAVELAPRRVNAVCPGLVLTEVWDSVPEDQREARLQRMTAHQPLPRPGAPNELAEAYLYLMCCGYTTGQVLIVDGGRSLV